MSCGKPKWADDLQKRLLDKLQDDKLVSLYAKNGNAVISPVVSPVNPVLSEKDFYPPKDKRCLRSGVRDIKGGDNFAEYAEYYFDTYGEDS